MAETGRRTFPAGEKPPSRNPGATALPKQPRERIIISRQMVIVTLNDGKPTSGSDRLASLMREFGAKLQQDREHNEDVWHNIRPDAPRPTLPSGPPTPGSPRHSDDVIERVLGDLTAVPTAIDASSLGSPLVASALPSGSTPPGLATSLCPPLVDEATVPTDIAEHTTVEDILTTIRGPYPVNCSSQFAVFEETADDCPVSTADHEDNSTTPPLTAFGAPPALTKAERRKLKRQEKQAAHRRDDALLEAASTAAQLEAATLAPPAAASPKAQGPACKPTPDSEPPPSLLDKRLADATAARVQAEQAAAREKEELAALERERDALLAEVNNADHPNVDGTAQGDNAPSGNTVLDKYRADLASLQLQDRASSTDFLHWLEQNQVEIHKLQALGQTSTSEVVEAFRRLHDDDTAQGRQRTSAPQHTGARSNDGTVPTDITSEKPPPTDLFLRGHGIERASGPSAPFQTPTTPTSPFERRPAPPLG